MNVAGQLIFMGAPPAFTQVSEGLLEMLLNLPPDRKPRLTFTLQFSNIPTSAQSSATQAGLHEIFINNTKSYADKIAEFPLDVFDYRQAIVNLNASYNAIRDHSQIARFQKDPLFSLVFINEEVAIFHNKFDSFLIASK